MNGRKMIAEKRFIELSITKITQENMTSIHFKTPTHLNHKLIN